MATPPVELKALGQFLKRAEELDKAPQPEAKIVAFYCRQMAIELGIKLTVSTPEAKSFLMGVMDQLETDKAALGDVTREDGEQIVFKFAVDVFAKADAEDRGVGSSKSTAQSFYAASTFFDVLKQFGDRGSDADEKCRYSKWKAAQILKCLKEGRPIDPGGPEEEQDAFALPEIPTTTPELVLPSIVSPASPPKPSAPSAPPPSYDALPAQSTVTHASSPPTHAAPSPPRPAPSPPRPVYQPETPPAPKIGLTPASYSDAIEQCKFAISALEAKDASLALERLHGAMRSLRD